MVSWIALALGSSSQRVVHLSEQYSARSFQAESFGPAARMKTVPRPSFALSWSPVFQARSLRSRSSSLHKAGCFTASSSSSVVITPHFE